MKAAVARVDDNCARYGIDAWIDRPGELSLAHLPSRVSELAQGHEFLAKTFGEKTTLLTREALRERGASGPAFHGGLLNGTGLGIHPLRYARGLAKAAVAAGARIHGRPQVVRWVEERDHRLVTARGSLRATHVVVATNGYTPENVSRRHAGRLMPALSNIVVTRPIAEEERREQGWTSPAMAFDTRNLPHYFRLLQDGRFLFGGRGGTDSTLAGAEAMKRHMADTLRRMFPVFGRAGIAYFWRGYICLAYDLVPYAGPLDERRTVWTAIAYHGNGIAVASHAGRGPAHLIIGDSRRAGLPALMTRRLARFPLPAPRPVYLKGAYLWFGFAHSR